MKMINIYNYYKIATDVKKLNNLVINKDKIIPKDVIKYVQTKLMELGYDLPIYGPDGSIGRETNSAILKFKKDFGLPENYTFSQIELDILEEKIAIKNNNKKDIENNKILTSDKVLLFGDSQMQGGIGKALESIYGGERIYKHGSNASYWYSNPILKIKLKERPSKIVIHLNGNGTSGTENLINLIKSITPNSYIIWYGAPPAILKKNSPYDKVRTPEALRSFNNFRNNSNKYVESVLSNSGLNYKFINPFLDIFTFNEGQAYSCNNCDGIHVPESIAKDKYTFAV